MEGHLSVEEFISALEDFASRDFPVTEVRRFLEKTRLSPGGLEPYSFFSPEQYTRNLIYKSADFELLAICWRPGQSAPAHGHEGEKCWARVESGRLRFTNYVEEDGDERILLRTTASTTGGAGYVDGPADIHAVENLFDRPAVTLHLYSRPYESCDIYDLERGVKQRKRLDYYSRFGRRE